ncbi:zinc ribbon domain-containing protein [Hoyosella altamirensis]|uniref:zinc ribbon domain-containing protein n=1 Tax=Hoyosella altamirensis TaxID=616997 RepID=UPI0012EE7A78|nr:zinc ribbon domain-containing protein [Hoyosella altamirensis]
MTSSTSVPAPARRTRGRSKTANWRRPEQVAVIALELDVSADSVMRRRVEQHWSAVFRLRRALQRDARNACTAYLAAHRERETGYKAVLARLGLSRKGVEARAKTHAEDSGWMRDHLTKATGLHVADEVWETCDRFLFPDRTGKRFGTPQIGSWWNFARIPGRARSHTKTQPTWETYRLVGTLQGHLDTYSTTPGLSVDQAIVAAAGASVLTQPKHLTAPSRPPRTWWDHTGALAVVYTGLPGGDLVLPVRLPQGAGQWPRLAHFLADPNLWHKIDLVRVRDRHAPGGWRYQAHLVILGHGWTSPAVAAARAAAPLDRCAGVDGNVSNIAIASFPNPGDYSGVVLTSRVTITGEQRAVTEREAHKARGRQRALDRSRRANNTSQYRLSRKQQARAQRRAAAGLEPKQVTTPGGARHANGAGVPKRAYRRDALSRRYQQIRADHAAASAAAAHRKACYARDTARAIVATHGPNLVTEDVSIRTWALRWGRGIAAFSPGIMLAALTAECETAGGRMSKASTWTTALSQHCVCGARAKKALSQRTHSCGVCGFSGDRDIVSALLAATVTHGACGKDGTPDPKTAYINHAVRVHAHQLVTAGHVQNIPVTGNESPVGTAQQEGPDRSTVHHNPTPAVLAIGEDGSHTVAPAGQGERPALSRNRPHRQQSRTRGWRWGRRRNRRTSHTPTKHESAHADL